MVVMNVRSAIIAESTLLCITTLGDYLRSRTSRKESNL